MPTEPFIPVAPVVELKELVVKTPPAVTSEHEQNPNRKVRLPRSPVHSSVPGIEMPVPGARPQKS
jgi:hypothetical protein